MLKVCLIFGAAFLVAGINAADEKSYPCMTGDVCKNNPKAPTSVFGDVVYCCKAGHGISLSASSSSGNSNFNSNVLILEGREVDEAVSEEVNEEVNEERTTPKVTVSCTCNNATGVLEAEKHIKENMNKFNEKMKNWSKEFEEKMNNAFKGFGDLFN